MNKLLNILIFIVIILLSASCDGIFPTASKINVPADHSRKIGYALHKPGYQYPFSYDAVTGDEMCGSAKCHHSNLKGGLSFIDNHWTVAPSCYQCHGKLWRDFDTVFTRINNTYEYKFKGIQ